MQRIKITNPLNRSLEEKMAARIADRPREVTKQDMLDDIKRRIATYREQWGEDPELEDA